MTLFDQLPGSALDAMDWDTDQYEPYFKNLLERDLTTENIAAWVADWSKLAKLLYESYARLSVATTVDTTDEDSENRYKHYVNVIYPFSLTYDNKLNHKLLDSGLKPDNFDIPLKKIKVDAELFQEENLPLLSQLSELGLEYDKIIAAQTVEWEGEEITLTQLNPVMQDLDREKRQKAWKLTAERRLQDRQVLNDLWVKLMDLRGRLAKNAGLPDFRAYAWKSMHRFDYTPEDSFNFQNAIETAVVPVSKKLHDKLRDRLGVETLRPWDVSTEGRGAAPDPKGRIALKPYETTEQLETGLEVIFSKVDPKLGEYFKVMRDENLLDLDNRKGKAPGGYCTDFPVAERPFIFMNAVGIHDDVQTLLHEGGHAFHVFESAHLPYLQQMDVPIEFAEVASMSMELIASPYLDDASAGFYNAEESARARVEHLESGVHFWPYMAVVDSFQHWVYTHHEAASNPVNCDAKWSELWDRFIPGIDFSGYEDVKATGWQRKLHIFQIPFYYIEYGLAQLGAVQVWANSLTDQAQAVRQYRHALSLGGTKTLPELFEAAGAKLAFDSATLGGAVELMELTIKSLDPA